MPALKCGSGNLGLGVTDFFVIQYRLSLVTLAGLDPVALVIDCSKGVRKNFSRVFGNQIDRYRGRLNVELHDLADSHVQTKPIVDAVGQSYREVLMVRTRHDVIEV